MEPRFAAIVSRTTTGIRNFSFCAVLRINIVIGTKVRRATSFVMNIERMKTIMKPV
jgi:hypothetical protein